MIVQKARITAKAQKAISLCIALYGEQGFDWLDCLNLLEQKGFRWVEDTNGGGEWTTLDNELIEHLAEYAHEAWAGWMKYLFEQCGPYHARGDNGEYLETGARTIPVWAVERWQRQMSTPYTDLPEDEKESDRDEARKILERIQSL